MSSSQYGPLPTDMEKQHLDNKGVFDESHVPLALGGRYSGCKTKWASLGPAKKALSLLFLAWMGVGMITCFKGIFGRRGFMRGGGGVGCGFRFPPPTFAPAIYFASTNKYLDDDNDDLYNTSNATFPLDPLKTLRLEMPEGIDGEVVISHSIIDAEDDEVVHTEGQVMVESFWIEGDDALVMDSGMGMWSDMWTDTLFVNASTSTHKIYYRIHIILPPTIPVPDLSTNLPLRLADPSSEITFTHLTLSTMDEGRNITGKFNVTRSLEFSTLTGDIDVDVYVVPPPMLPCGRHGRPGHRDPEHEGEKDKNRTQLEQGEEEEAQIGEQDEEKRGRWWWPFDHSSGQHPHGPHHGQHPRPPHHGPPTPHGPVHHHGPPHHGPPRPHGPDHHGPHDGPPHPPHRGPGGPHPPPGGPHQGPPPPPLVIARSTTGSVTLRIHSPVLNVSHSPPHMSANFSIPIDIAAHTTTGSITIIDKTFFGLFDAGAVKGKIVVGVEEEGKEVKIIHEKVGERVGAVKGFVKHTGQPKEKLEWIDENRDVEKGPGGSPRPPPPPHGPPGHHGPPHGPPGGPHGPPHDPHDRPHGPLGPHGPPPPGLSRVRAHTVIGDVKLQL